MLTIDCGELSADEELALASSISDAVEGRGIALVRGREIVIDEFGKDLVTLQLLLGIIKESISKRKDWSLYSVQSEGDRIVIRSPDPLARTRKRRMAELPPNLFKCPYCWFVTKYEEEYDVHRRIHPG